MSSWQQGNTLPRIHSEKDLENIQDLATAFGVMEQLHITDIDDVNDLQDALARIKLKFSKRNAEQIYHEQVRDMSSVILSRGLPPMCVHLLFTKSRAWSREKGSGKSSLVNLLAGDKILPCDLVSGTKTICELRHSETRRFVLHHWDDHQSPVIQECRQESEIAPFLTELARMVTCVDQRTKKSPFERIEIFWPLPILGEGVVMVDSPGVGESRKVSQQLEQYMARAFGFIYVINISNAGGIHKDRLGQLLRQAVERSDQGFDPSTALFVCNWWDQVALKDQEHVRKETLNRLARVWPGVQPQQTFPLSCTQSLKAVDKGQVDDRYRELVQGIRQVLPATFNVKLSQYYRWLSAVLKRWLSAVLKRSLYSLKISSNVGRRQVVEKEATFRNVRNQIEALESSSGSQIDFMRDGFRREVDNISRKLMSFMRSDKCVLEMTRWSPAECPPHDKDTKKMLKEAASRFVERLAGLVDVWETQNNLVSKIRSNILKTFQRDLELFEDQIKRVEGVLFEGMDNRIITDLHNSMRHQMPVKNVWKKARKDKAGIGTDMGCFSLGSAISGSKVLDLKASCVKNVFKSGVGPQTMGEVCKAFLMQYKDNDLTSPTKKFFDRIAKRFDAATQLLPEFLKADQHLLQVLQGEVKGEQERLAGLYPELLHTAITMQGNLDMFYVQRLMRFDFSMKDLKYDRSSPIGRGSFADVYRSSMHGGEVVALKIQRDPLTPKTVTDVLLEDRTLRELEHDNVIRYYGAARDKKGGELRWVMVLEYCSRTIKQYFLSENANVPGRQEIVSLQLDAMRETANIASQICSAICYLHNKGIVHRDLKPDNILLTDDMVVKITDVGLAKPAKDIVNTVAGTPVYMAPEVLLQKGQYDMKVDIYSLAIILWELWYGQDAADHISSHLFRRLEDAVKDGLRPSVTLANKPPDDWLKLIQSGWEFHAERRPHSREFCEFFDDFLKHAS
ncbi:hypothetical protein ACOMHN_008795 [Nucella lapillus]